MKLYKMIIIQNDSYTKWYLCKTTFIHNDNCTKWNYTIWELYIMIIIPEKFIQNEM